jgi:putative addiction module component (TIGR02574 family)
LGVFNPWEQCVMTDIALRLKDELLRLPEADRVELARVLWDSLDQESVEAAEIAWEAELNRRFAEIEAGAASGRPAKEVFDELQQRYR